MTPPKPPTVARTPHPVDVAVGGNLRLIRKRLGASQSEMADALALTFQQVQKYEKGVNRVSASKLYEVAEWLGIDVEDLFAGLPRRDRPPTQPPALDPTVKALAASSEGLLLARAFAKISKAKDRRLLVDLAQKLARMRDDEPSE